MTRFLLNGSIAQNIDIADRGLQYGDGFFTTIRVVHGRLQLWPLHWQRLAECAQKLGFNPFNSTAMEQCLIDECQQLLSAQPRLDQELVLRITITRGSGGRGYTPPQNCDFHRLIALSPMPQTYPAWREAGVSLGLSQLRLGDQPMLNGLKTLNRLEQVLLKQELTGLQEHQQIDDLLVLDQRGFVAESTAANLMWCKNGRWFTPALRHGGVRGVMCQFLKQALPVETGDYRLPDLLAADHVFICNSLMGAISVNQLMIDAISVHHFSVSSQASFQLTKRIREDE